MLLFYSAPPQRAEKHAAAAKRPEMKTPEIINPWQNKLAHTAFLKSYRKDMIKTTDKKGKITGRSVRFSMKT